MQGSSITRRVTVAALAALALTVSPPARAAAGPLIVAGAWTRPAAAEQTGAGYFSITNQGRAAEKLISASSPAATRVSIHVSAMVGSVVTMRPVDAVTIPAGATVAFQPGGLHLMLEGLKHPLTAGQRVTVTLVFVKAGRRIALFTVRDGPPSPAMAGMKM